MCVWEREGERGRRENGSKKEMIKKNDVIFKLFPYSCLCKPSTATVPCLILLWNSDSWHSAWCVALINYSHVDDCTQTATSWAGFKPRVPGLCDLPYRNLSSIVPACLRKILSNKGDKANWLPHRETMILPEVETRCLHPWERSLSKNWGRWTEPYDSWQ